MKIIITGGAGFIGSHIAEFLSDYSDVTVIDDLTTGNEGNLKNVPTKFLKGSVQDTSLLTQEFKDEVLSFTTLLWYRSSIQSEILSIIMKSTQPAR